MKSIVFDISSKSNFTVWESGFWDAQKQIGTGTIVADQAGGRLKPVYFVNPKAGGSRHALFFANLGYIVASTFVARQGKEYLLETGLFRVRELKTKRVQGRTLPDPTLETLWYYKGLTPEVQADTLTSNADLRQLESIPNSRDLIRMSMEKSMTSPKEQKAFWSFERDPVGQNTYDE